jgi:hypothetical protein
MTLACSGPTRATARKQFDKDRQENPARVARRCGQADDNRPLTSEQVHSVRSRLTASSRAISGTSGRSWADALPASGPLGAGGARRRPSGAVFRSSTRPLAAVLATEAWSGGS